jgi:hypothetical protein
VDTSVVVVSLVMGSIFAYVAFRRQVNPWIGFCLGFCLGLSGVLFAMFLLPRKRPTKRRFQPYLEGPTDKLWYYLNKAEKQEGPMSFFALEKELLKGKIGKKTLVWHEGLIEWQPLSPFIKRKSTLSKEADSLE